MALVPRGGQNAWDIAQAYSNIKPFMPYVRAAARGVRKYGRRMVKRLTGKRPATTSLARKIGGGVNKRRKVLPRRNKRKRVIQDQGGYTQFKAYRFKSGKRRKANSKRQSILNTIITRQRLRYSAINELSVGSGAVVLKHGSDGDGVDSLPILVFNLSNVRQGNEGFFCPFNRLRINTTTGALQWQNTPAVAENGSTLITDWLYEDSEGANTAVGRKSFLDWVRVRLTMWGKQTAPGKITLQLVTLPDEEYCPEFQPAGQPVTKDADFFWKQQVKPLINNPASGVINNVGKKMKVHKQWTFNFDPTSTTESDTDPHCKFFDFFHRVGRVIDYSTNRAAIDTYAELDNPSAYRGDNIATDIAWGYLPKYLNKSLYFVIKSMQQDKVDIPSVANTASFDFNFQVCHRTVQPNITG